MGHFLLMKDSKAVRRSLHITGYDTHQYPLPPMFPGDYVEWIQAGVAHSGLFHSLEAEFRKLLIL